MKDSTNVSPERVRACEAHRDIPCGRTRFKELRRTRADFPKPILVGPRTVLFDRAELREWVARQPRG